MPTQHGIYRSTAMLFTLVAGFFGLLNLVGTAPDPNQAITHGWPFPYVYRSPLQEQYWAITKNVIDFHFLALVTDALIAIMVTMLAAAGWQFHLRKYGSLRRFGLRSLLVVTALVALFVSRLGPSMNRSVHQSAAIRRLKQAGQQVEIGLSAKQNRGWYEALDPTLRRTPANIYVQDGDLRDGQLLSADAFQGIDRLNIRDSQLSDSTYAAIGNLERLLYLRVSRSKRMDAIHTANLQEISGLSQLVSIELSGIDLSNASLTSLERLQSLRLLCLRRSIVADSQLESLAKLPMLTCLDLGQTPITDGALAWLESSNSLVRLNIDSTNVTQTGIQRLRQKKPRLDICD